MKVWHHGVLKTIEQMHKEQTPSEIYHDCCLRMEASSPADAARLRKRWPTLGDCNRAMTTAYAALSADQRADEDARAAAELEFLAVFIAD